MSEPITSLDDLGEVIIVATFPRPDGKIIEVRVRTLGNDEAWRIRQSIQWPKAPITDYHKVGGEALPVRDYQDEGYLKQQREADRELAYCNIAASLVMDIPGATLAEKGKTLEQKIGRWAFDYLLGIVNRINIIEQEAIDQVVNSFRYETAGGAAGDDRGASVPVQMAELIEG